VEDAEIHKISYSIFV